MQKKINENTCLSYGMKIIKDSKDALEMLEELLVKRRTSKKNG